MTAIDTISDYIAAIAKVNELRPLTRIHDTH
jgi:hypothetical protein